MFKRFNTGFSLFVCLPACLVCLGAWRSDLAAQGQEKRGVILETKGYITPAVQTVISPKVRGQIIQMPIEIGQTVVAGDVLARLEPGEHEAALRVARAKLKFAQARLAQAQHVAAKDMGGKAAIEIAEAEVAIAQAGVAVAEQRLDGAIVRAPFAGTILTKRAEVGTFVDPKGFQVAAHLCDMADLRTLDVEVWIGVKDMEKIFTGQECAIRPEALKGVGLKGKVIRIGPMADRSRAAIGVRVRIDLPAGEDRLRPELGAIVQFFAKE